MNLWQEMVPAGIAEGLLDLKGRFSCGKGVPCTGQVRNLQYPCYVGVRTVPDWAGAAVTSYCHAGGVLIVSTA